MGEGFAALGAQGIRLIQDPRNPPAALAGTVGRGICRFESRFRDGKMSAVVACRHPRRQNQSLGGAFRSSKDN